MNEDCSYIVQNLYFTIITFWRKAGNTRIYKDLYPLEKLEIYNMIAVAKIALDDFWRKNFFRKTVLVNV